MQTALANIDSARVAVDAAQAGWRRRVPDHCPPTSISSERR
ncbi:MAG: hypothetical protein U0531_00835 [Dehalococcoidia bacterium]